MNQLKWNFFEALLINGWNFKVIQRKTSENNETTGHLIRLIEEIFHSFFNPMDQSVGITKHIKTQNENVELANSLQQILDQFNLQNF